MKALIIVGTAREGRNTIEVAEAVRDGFDREGHDFTFYDLKEKKIPPLGNRSYKDEEKPVPEDIQQLSNEVEKADAIVLVSPEYNHGIPGVLKNALDHLYPEYQDKLFSYVTVSAGGFGGIRCLEKLQSFTLAVKGDVGPDLNVSNVNDHFNEEGADEEYREKIEYFVNKVEEE